MNQTLVTATSSGRPDFLLRSAGQDGDCDRIREFVCALSPLSQYFRFFASVAPPSTSLLRALCGDTGADILLITDSSGAVVGHGMAADSSGPGQLATDIGLAIADEWQQQGLGTMLLDALFVRAARRGVSQLVLDVLPANARMLGIIGRRWPDAPRERTRDAIVIRPAIALQPDITPQTASAPVTRPVTRLRPPEGATHAARQPAA